MAQILSEPSNYQKKLDEKFLHLSESDSRKGWIAIGISLVNLVIVSLIFIGIRI